MRTQKLREEEDEKERDEHFNVIQLMIPMKKEWRVKEKASTPILMASNDNMDLLDDDESPLIKDGSPPPNGMDINMLFTLPAKFRGAKEEVAQMCLNPKEVVFEKPKESSQHLKPLYVRGHIDGKLISRMLVDSGVVINLISYAVFKKLGWGGGGDKLVKTNLTLNGVGATRWRPEASSPWSSPWGANCSLLCSSLSRWKVTIALFLAVIGFTPTAEFLLLCINI
jgi:hypothetical protein